MPISFKSVTSATVPTYWLKPAANSNLYYANGTYAAGVYMLYLYPNDNATNTGTITKPSVEFKSSSGTSLASVGSGIAAPTNEWLDLDTGSTSNTLFTVIVLSQAATSIEYNALGNSVTLMLQKSSDAVVSATGYYAVTTITASGSVTLSRPTNTIYAIGGGGGGSGHYSNAYFGGSGGGSGYMATGTLSAGTYTATIGAGGSGGGGGGDNPGGSGGTTSISTISASGGGGGVTRGGSAGSGGSGGGGGAYGNSGGYAGTGGARGNSGTNGGGSWGTCAGGSGSGITPPSLPGITFPSAGGGPGGGGVAGGIYAGGGGGNYPSYGTGGTAAANTGGGGGGGGGIGGTGVIYVKAAY